MFCYLFVFFIVSKRLTLLSNWADDKQTSWIIALWWLSVSLWRICITFFDQVGHFASIKLCLALSHQGAIIKIPVVRCHYLWCLGAQLETENKILSRKSQFLNQKWSLICWVSKLEPENSHFWFTLTGPLSWTKLRIVVKKMYFLFKTKFQDEMLQEFLADVAACLTSLLWSSRAGTNPLITSFFIGTKSFK